MTHKLADRWEEEIWVVIAQPNFTIPVYSVRKLDGSGRLRTLHRNMLLPVRSVPNAQSSGPKPPPQRTLIRTRYRSRQRATASSSLSPEDSALSFGNASVIFPQPQSSLAVVRADSSLDLDDDETSVLLEESLILTDGSGGSDAGFSAQGGHEADVSDSELDPGNGSIKSEHTVSCAKPRIRANKPVYYASSDSQT